MKLVEQYGHVYKLSNPAYKRLLRLISTGREWDIETIGGKDLGLIDAKPLLLSPWDAKVQLDILQQQKYQ